MPHEFVIGAFEPGDDDMGDFMLDRWLPFARDLCNWVDNRAPTVGTRPDVELWTHRGTTGSPLAPYIFFRTFDRHLMIFTGNGVNLAQEIYDQPGNPANAPITSAMTFPSSGSISTSMRTSVINSIVGPYEAYWLFCDTSGSYIHCVVKVNSRQYRHFHVGKLQQVDDGPDLNSESFYVTGHFWSDLDPEALFWPPTAAADAEHSPYGNQHQPPFRNSGGTSLDGAFGTPMLNTVPPSRFYMPRLHLKTVSAAVVNAGGTGHVVDDIITLNLGTGGAGTVATLRVTAETGGVIDTVSVETVGDYDTIPDPTTAITQASSTGSGINATFDLTFIGHDWYHAQPSDEILAEGNPATKETTGGGPVAVGDVNTSVRIGTCQTNYYDGGLGSILWACDRNFTANSNELVPIQVAATFDFQSDARLGIVARVPDIFRVNMRDFSPEQEITIGAETYKIFPVINDDAVNTLAGEGYSAWEGLAYRVETGAVV